MKHLGPDIEFFYGTEPFTPSPDHELTELDRLRFAKDMVAIEEQARAADLSFAWERERGGNNTWTGRMYDAQGDERATWSNQDFPPTGTPHASRDRRFFEAMMAQGFFEPLEEDG